MPIVIRDATNTPRTVTAIIVRDATNTARTISEIWVRDTTNTPRKVFSLTSPLSASASPSTVYGNGFGTGTAPSNSTTVTPSGGTAPYTYSWVLLMYSSATPPTVSGPTSAVTTFVQTALAPGDYQTATFQCTVTDSATNTTTVDVDAVFAA